MTAGSGDDNGEGNGGDDALFGGSDDDSYSEGRGTFDSANDEGG